VGKAEIENKRYKRLQQLRKEGWTEKRLRSWCRGWDSVEKARRLG